MNTLVTADVQGKQNLREVQGLVLIDKKGVEIAKWYIHKVTGDYRYG